MPWKINELEKTRWDFVQARIRKTESMRSLCQRFKISRRCGYKWWGRFVAEGKGGLHARKRCPGWVESWQRRWQPRILALRHEEKDFGPEKLHWLMEKRWPRQGGPAQRTIGRWLVAAGQVRRRVRRPQAGPTIARCRPGRRRRPNDVWTADFKGWFLTGNKTRVCPLTVRDLATRFVLAVRHVRPAKEPQVGAVLRALFRRYRRPRAIKVDNGAPFGGPGPRGWTALSVAWIRLGVRVEYNRPGCPQDNAAHEQMHRVLKKATATPPAYTLAEQQHRFDRWRRRYNHHRPHRSLHMRVPGKLYQVPLTQPARPDWNYPSAWQRLHPDAKGRVRWRRRQRLIGQAFARRTLGLKPISASITAVYFGPHLLGTLHAADLAGLRPVRWR